MHEAIGRHVFFLNNERPAHLPLLWRGETEGKFAGQEALLTFNDFFNCWVSHRVFRLNLSSERIIFKSRFQPLAPFAAILVEHFLSKGLSRLNNLKEWI